MLTVTNPSLYIPWAVHTNWFTVFSTSFIFSPPPDKCEENTSLADCSRYLKMPFSKANLPSNNQTLKGNKETFWITSFLCSTKLTQNGKPRLWDIDISISVTCPMRYYFLLHSNSWDISNLRFLELKYTSCYGKVIERKDGLKLVLLILVSISTNTIYALHHKGCFSLW